MEILPPDFAQRIREIRKSFNFSQTDFADAIGVSYASVSRWERGKAEPNALAWEKILGIEAGKIAINNGTLPAMNGSLAEGVNPPPTPDRMAAPRALSFSAHFEDVRAMVEGHRLALGHQANPAFATETSLIDPLPHQRLAVYERMLEQPRLRFLLADDPGAGKTIMAGLYIRESLSRRRIRRVLVVSPAGLLGNWEREMRTLFSLPFTIATGSSIARGNPFTGPDSDLLIVSIDTLAGAKMFACLQEPGVQPYDLVIFDEAHKLSADIEADQYLRRTDRYRVAEALVGLGEDETERPGHAQDGRGRNWQLDWACRHVLLMTATPHMGRKEPYFLLWRLLDAEAFPSLDAFERSTPTIRRRYFIRRTKEEMVDLLGKPLYPHRESNTFSYSLTPAEKELYDRTTDYIQLFYNRASMLNRTAAAFAKGVFQRRLASSTFALLQSLIRRREKLDRLIADVQAGKTTIAAEQAKQRQLDFREWETITADEEPMGENGREAHEAAEEDVFALAISNLADLKAERVQVDGLVALAQSVYEQPPESKFLRLRELISEPEYRDEKIIIFTEHRDTLAFLDRRFKALGHAGKIAIIHGGMRWDERDEQMRFFRRPIADGGARFMIATDAAGEGINLQVAWILVNYDLPWNPARLEQRMGRIHRYGQVRDKVAILNLVADGTREGRVMGRLLEKLEEIADDLGNDKVFDVIGRLFKNVSLAEFLQTAMDSEDAANRAVAAFDGTLTREQVERLDARERSLVGDGGGGEVKSQLHRVQQDVERETYRRLLPGYVRRFIERSAERIGIAVEPIADAANLPTVRLRALQSQALAPLIPAYGFYGADLHQPLAFSRPKDAESAIFVHPGEPLFDHWLGTVNALLGPHALAGATFTDPAANQPYFLHVLTVRVDRDADAELPALAHPQPLEFRLTALKHAADGQFEILPPEHLLVLRGREGVPLPLQSFAARAAESREQARDVAAERVAQPLVGEHRRLMAQALPERIEQLSLGYRFQEINLATRRAALQQRIAKGDHRVAPELEGIKRRQRRLKTLKEQALAALQREPDLVRPGEIEFIAHALVVPASFDESPELAATPDGLPRAKETDEVEAIAMAVARAYEEAHGATVVDVSTPAAARLAGLGDYPGYDLQSTRPDGDVRAIEVKGRVAVGDIEMTENEFAQAQNLADRYWLYVVFDCGTANPRVNCVQNPATVLDARPKGVIVAAANIIMKTDSTAEGETSGGVYPRRHPAPS